MKYVLLLIGEGTNKKKNLGKILLFNYVCELCRSPAIIHRPDELSLRHHSNLLLLLILIFLFRKKLNA